MKKLLLIIKCLPHKEGARREPNVWKEFTLCIRREHVRRIVEVLAIKRLKYLKKIRLNKLCLNNATDNATVFNVIALKESVEELVINKRK